jgi:hypothetical protein
VLHVDEARTTALGQNVRDPAMITRVETSRAGTFCFHHVLGDQKAQPGELSLQQRRSHQKHQKFHVRPARERQEQQRQQHGHAQRRRYQKDAAMREGDMNTAVELEVGGRLTFGQRVQQSITRLHGRQFVLVTYHNVGMLDWAVLFWKWLHRAGMRRFMLLELDGLTCDAARRLNCSLHFECATARDMTLARQYIEIQHASSMQEWGTDAASGYFKFLRWKLCIVELLLGQGVDVLMADVDVLVLSPAFFSVLVTSPHDLTISSDARRGRYNDNPHCPCSHPMYQRYSADWVCAGNFYMRDTKAARWFMHEVQELMEQFMITDQDAMQAVLTGHTQVAVPQMRVNASSPEERLKKRRVEAIKAQRGYRPSPEWHRPLWLEGLHPSQTLRNTRGIQPLNTPMRMRMWEGVSSRRRASGFTWAVAPPMRFANGPMIVDHWNNTFRRSDGAAVDAAASPQPGHAGFVSVHANCNVKAFLMAEEHSSSFLLHPPEPAE